LEALITALVLSVTEWSKDRGLLVELEGHGRDNQVDVDLSRTVGWFTSIFPAWFQTLPGHSPRQQVGMVREQLQIATEYSLDYGILRYLNSESPVAQELARIPRAEICFNYLGQFDALPNQTDFFLTPAGSYGATRDPDEQREWIFEINCSIIQGQFRVLWGYSRNLHRAETVERLAQDYRAALRRLLASSAVSTQAETESELEDLEIDSRKLDSILARISVHSQDAST
jgi:microcystin synthetase protein McyA